MTEKGLTPGRVCRKSAFYGTLDAIAATILGKKGEILAAFTKKRHYTHSSCNRGKGSLADAVAAEDGVQDGFGVQEIGTQDGVDAGEGAT